MNRKYIITGLIAVAGRQKNFTYHVWANSGKEARHATRSFYMAAKAVTSVQIFNTDVE